MRPYSMWLRRVVWRWPVLLCTRPYRAAMSRKVFSSKMGDGMFELVRLWKGWKLRPYRWQLWMWSRIHRSFVWYKMSRRWILLMSDYDSSIFDLGTWGRGCNRVCQCSWKNSESCDTATGRCLCRAGFTGTHCTERLLLYFTLPTKTNFKLSLQRWPMGSWVPVRL